MAQYQRTLPYRPSTRPGTTTATQTQTQTPTETPVLRLRAVQDEVNPNIRSRQRLHWAEDAVDNEGLGRKKSKGTSCVLAQNLLRSPDLLAVLILKL